MIEPTTPMHQTNNLLLRWFANYVSSPIAYRYFDKSLRIYFRDEDGIEPITSKLKSKMDFYYKLYKIIGIPYEKWGTTYLLNHEWWIEELQNDPLLGKIGSDYDEDGIPYWHYQWHEDPITGDAWKLIKNDS